MLDVLKYVAIALDVIVAIVLIVVVLLQSGKSEGLGAIAGNSGSFVSKNGSKTFDAKLASATKWIGLAFAFLTLATVILVRISYATAQVG